MSKRAAPSLGDVPVGAFSWATIYQFDEKQAGRIKHAAIHETDIYTGGTGEGVKRWSVVTGG